MASGKQRKFPGFGLGVEYQPSQCFPLAVDQSWQSYGVSLREQRMLEFIDKITDKPSWEEKVFDEEIVAKWRKEADVRPEGLGGDVLLSQEMFDFVCCPTASVPRRPS